MGNNNSAHASSELPKSVPLHLLEKMTNGFSKDRELGTGAFAKVYKGVQENGETIAVKLLHPMPGRDDENFEKEFRNLTSLRHKNIVRLVGFCHETQKECVQYNGKMIFAERIRTALCFEYMHNGSLDNYLFDEYSGHDWPTRYAIIKGICGGLKYLHEESKPPIYHLDLKPANILLDDNMIPKLADFGLSRFVGQERTRTTESCIGTIGYLPPEYIERNVISNKLDIFSLGVIIIKIITGPTGYTQCAEMASKQFIELVHEKWGNRLQATSLDSLEPYSKQVMRCIEMALSCVEKDRHKRPSIGYIIDELNKTETTDQASSMDKVASVDMLAKSVVEGALSKAQLAIEEEARLRQSAQRDLVFITTEFKMMQSFLRVADEERVNNVVVMTWVRQIRELAYDVENCIEFVLHQETIRQSWARSFPLCKPVLTLEEIGRLKGIDEIGRLKARVEDVSRRNVRCLFRKKKRNVRYNLIRDYGSKPVPVQQQPGSHAAVGYDMRRQHVLGDLTQLITNKDDADLQVISVWGAGGGIGTTPIIRKAYSDPEISHSFTCRAWVNLTRPFNPHEFIRSLTAHFYANSCQERQGAIIGVDVLTSMDASTTQGDLLSEFIQLVGENRYLVVLEDLSTMAEWDSIRTFLPDRKNGSRIIVSSQQYEIASLCVGHPYQVLDLPAEHPVCAFLREGPRGAGDKTELNNDGTWTSNKEISTEYDLSHNHRNSHSSYHRITNSKKKAARDWMQNSPLVGRRLQMNQRRHYTVQAQMNHSQVVSVWGVPGVGKSALVRNLYLLTLILIFVSAYLFFCPWYPRR